MAGFTYQDMLKFADSPRQEKHLKNDSMIKEGGLVHIAYRGNRIATWNPVTKKMNISSAGWQTVTTKDRLNKILPSGYVSQFLGDWYYVGHNHIAVPFKDGMVADPNQAGKPFEQIMVEKRKAYRIEKKIEQKDIEYERKSEPTGHETEFATITPQGKKVDVMKVDLGKVPSKDPLAFSFGLHQGLSGQPMDVAPTGESLAPEYVRGYKLGAKRRRAELFKMFRSKKAQMPLTMTKVPKLGSKGSGWHKEPVSHSYARKNGHAPARYRGR